MALYLWAYWRVIGGGWGPRGSEAALRRNLRANRVAGSIWVPALLAGLLGFGALLALLTVMARLVSLPASAPITMPAGMPFVTAFLLLVMASVVAGVTEESAFRGYMQGPIERRFGLAVAILINGTMFGLLHFPNHPADVLKMLPYYIAVSAVYGGLTWAVNSILPALVLHSAGDVWSLGRLWLTGRPEWQLSSSPPASIRETGADAGFVAAAAAFLALAGLTAWAYAGLYSCARMRVDSVVRQSTRPRTVGGSRHAAMKLVEECIGVGELSRDGEVIRQVPYRIARFQGLHANGLPVPGVHRIEGRFELEPGDDLAGLVGVPMMLRLEDGRALTVTLADAGGRVLSEGHGPSRCLCC
jgi:membrane protease YdiL (CAAX protease family)